MLGRVMSIRPARVLELRRSSGTREGLLGRWHRLAEREQSLLEDNMSHFSPRLATLSPSTLSWMAREGEREFYDDVAENAEQSSNKRTVEPPPSLVNDDATRAKNAFSSYSFSYSAILDKEGQHVLASTKRRRYEDSTGRLKACHERCVDGGSKKLTSTWTRPSNHVERPKCKTLLEGCVSVEEFEKQWANTAFDHEEEVKHDSDEQIGYGSRPFGPDVDAAKAAPPKEITKEAEGVTREAKIKSREAAIAEGSRTQEEETTPPS